MEYTKALINLIQKARRTVPTELKQKIKLADPNLLSELESIYKLSSDDKFKAIVREIFTHAGESWIRKIESSNYTQQSVADTNLTKNQNEQESLPRVTNSLIKGDLASILQRVD